MSTLYGVRCVCETPPTLSKTPLASRSAADAVALLGLLCLLGSTLDCLRAAESTLVFARLACCELFAMLGSEEQQAIESANAQVVKARVFASMKAGALLGLTNTIGIFASVLSNVATSAVLERTGSYGGVFALTAALYTFSAACFCAFASDEPL